MNIGTEYEGNNEVLGDWEDLQIEVTGPVVRRLHEQFAEDWYYATQKRVQWHGSASGEEKEGDVSPCQIIQGGPDSPHELMECGLVSLLQHARKRIWICTGYFVPNSVLLVAIKMAVCRGVDVRLLVAAKSEHPYLVLAGRSFYCELLAVGVRIYEYEAGINHTKASLIDDEWLLVGSSNVDNRSMRLNFELNVLLKNAANAAELEALFREYFATSKEITLESHDRRPLAQHLIEAACRPMAPLL
jgi:cardiolipin synthase